MDSLTQKLEEYQTKLGETKASLLNLTQTSDQAISEAFDSRMFIIALEATGKTFDTMGDNLRTGFVSALNEAADGMARIINEGGSVSEMLENIANQFATQQLGMMFQTNLNEGLAALVGGTNKDGTDAPGVLQKIGDATGITDVMEGATSWLGGLFGMGGDESSGAGAPPAPVVPDAVKRAGEAIGIGGGSASTANMNVTAGVVNVVGGGLEDLGGKAAEVLGDKIPTAVIEGMKPESEGFFSSLGDSLSGMFNTVMGWFSQSSGAASGGGGGGGGLGGLFSMFGGGGGGGGGGLGGLFGMFGGGDSAQAGAGASAKAGAGASAKAGAGASAGAASGGSFMGAMGGAGAGASMGASLGGAVGGEKGKKWGAILGALGGAYFGFGMADGGAITKLGMVQGSGRRGVDSVPVKIKGTKRQGLLAPGEGVLNVTAMDALGGSDFVHAANNGKLFAKAVGGAQGSSYNATQKMASVATTSVRSAPPIVIPAPETNFKNVNVFDESAIRSALQNRPGEDMMINTLRKRGALN